MTGDVVGLIQAVIVVVLRGVLRNSLCSGVVDRSSLAVQMCGRGALQRAHSASFVWWGEKDLWWSKVQGQAAGRS